MALDPRAAGQAGARENLAKHTLPKLVGHWRPSSGQSRQGVYGTAGPAPTPRLLGDGRLEPQLVLDLRGPAPGVRPLMPVGVWMMRGSTEQC